MSAGDVSLSGSIRAATNGFVRHALGSCVDYDLPSFCGSIEIDSSSVLIDELPFTMDDNFVVLSCEPYAKDLLLGAQSRHGIFREDFLVKAFGLRNASKWRSLSTALCRNSGFARYDWCQFDSSCCRLRLHFPYIWSWGC
ncbi:hypothetical protein CsSME_00022296 [Camellia sinensis var. sinensis]